MIFYTDRQMALFISSLPRSEFFYICSYGYHNRYKLPLNAKLLIAEPYLPECKPNCPECAEREALNHERLISSLKDKDYKLISDFHAKLVIWDTGAIIGSRNLTGSEFADVSILVDDVETITDLKEYFELLWNK